MNYIISVTNPDAFSRLEELSREVALPLNLAFHATGTAVSSMRELLGIESNERRVLISAANDQKTAEWLAAQKRQLHLGVPGHGLAVAVPVKSVGGGKTMAFLQEEASVQPVPAVRPDYELIVVIAAEGHTDTVMNAARAAGARGGTVLHGKGTGSGCAETFYNISLAEEKEVVLIVAAASEKADIMRAILEKAGPATPAQAITFSLPITALAGFGFGD